MIEITKEQRNRIEGKKFIDLFAGIGGFHLALSSFNAKCVFSSEWDKHAAEVYEKNFNIRPYGDITKIDEKTIKPHNILCAGFPCQAFSISGKQRGFDDSRGTLFFDIARIAKYHKPEILLLENVHNLSKHDNGRTLEVILKTLDEIGYDTHFKTLIASDYGIPQIRKRVFFVCFRKKMKIKDFQFPDPTDNSTKLSDFLEKNKISDSTYVDKEKLKSLKISKPKQLNIFKDINSSKSVRIGILNKGGQGERVYSPDSKAITLSAYGGGIGAKTGLYLIDEKIRRLTPRECANISGFPKKFILSKSNNQSYKQFGNTVVVDVVQNILIQLNKYL
tara:strand:+ start:2261 stop:3262 length:1002 start_codon:yes stop_codon:yes gene_type:complete